MGRARWYRSASWLAVAGLAMAAGHPVRANPEGGRVVGGEASIAGEGSALVTVTQASSRAVIDWTRFSVGAGESVVFRQPDARSVIANRVIGGDPSAILGSIEANGQVVLINRNGILFGSDARVDAAGLIATTHMLDTEAFLAGAPTLRFEDGGVADGEIVVEGRISVRDKGLAAFVAPHVRNDGLIVADLGRVALGAGTGFSVDLYGDGLISFAPGDEVSATLRDAGGTTLAALVENKGAIRAEGGQVLLTAAAAREVVNASINVAGLVLANSAESRDGVIRLSGSGAVQTQTDSRLEAAGGTVSVSGGSVALGGRVSTDATRARQAGGSVSVTTDGLLSLAGTVTARAALGAGGTVDYRADRIIENSDSLTDASGLTDGGHISVIADRQIATSGSYVADGAYGRGGRIDLTAADVRLLSANVAARGRQQGGLVRIGGEFQGGKEADPDQPYHASFVGRWGTLPSLASADQTFVNDSSAIDVSAARGAGGTAVIWSDRLTTFLGAIDARGGSGAGGSVELSSAEDLRQAELANVSVGNGHLLLDPRNITIGTPATISDWAYAGVLGAGYVRSVSPALDALDIADEFGSSVSLNAAGDRLAIGAYRDDNLSSGVLNTGAVYLYSFGNSTFGGGTLQAVLGKGYSGGKNIDVAALGAGDQFGAAVSLNAAGDRLAVGATADDGATNATSNSGAVYLFGFGDTSFGGGTLQAVLGKGYGGGLNIDVPGLEAGDNFGRSVSLNAAGDRLAVGAHLDDGPANATNAGGAAYLFRFSDTTFGGGTLEAVLGRGYAGGKNIDVAPIEAGDSLGSSVALNAAGDRLVVGAPADDGSGNATSNAGAAYLFAFTDTDFGGGTLQAMIGNGYTGGNNIDVTSLANGDGFGSSVSLNAAGDRLAVGADSDDGAANASNANIGAVHLFSFGDTSFSGGALQAVLGKGYAGGKNVDVPGLDAVDGFGTSVSLNAAGTRLAVGASRDDGPGNGTSSVGAVHLFSFADASFGGGALETNLGKPYPAGNNIDLSALTADDEFGSAVALNAAGDRLAVGAPRGPNVTDRTGEVYLFAFANTSFGGGALRGIIGKGYTGGNNIDVTSLADADKFGSSVSLNAAGDRLAVGALGDDGAANVDANSGAVYLFGFNDTSFGGGTLQAVVGRGYTGGNNVDVATVLGSHAFGNSVSLTAAGDRLAVGASGNAGAAGATGSSGAVYLFGFSDTSFGGGTLQAVLGKGYTGGNNVDVTALEANDDFGTSVSLSAAGDRLAVGAMRDDGAANAAADSGAVYLFGFNDTSFGGGTLQAVLGKGYTGGNNVDVTALQAGDFFGSGVSINAAGDRLAAGAREDSGPNNLTTAAGAVHLFGFDDASFGNGTLRGTLGKGYSGGNNVDVTALKGTVSFADRFGSSVSLNAAGDRLAVGALGHDGLVNTAVNSGGAFLFTFDDTDFSRGTLQSIIGEGYIGGNNVDVTRLLNDNLFGRSVAINAAGNRLAIGASGDNGTSGATTGAGAAYLFSFADTSFGGGALQSIIGQGYTGGRNVDVTSLEAGDAFGSSLSITATGNRLAVGAPGDDGPANATSNSGAVYLFGFNDTAYAGGALQATIGKGYAGGKNIDLTALEANDQFGASVSLNAAGDRLAAGAITDAGPSNAVAGAGAAYLFRFGDTSFSAGTLQATIGKGYTGGSNVDVSGLEASDLFATSLSLNAAGDRLAVGAIGDDGSGNATANSGALHLFGFTDTNFSGGSLLATLGKGYAGGSNVDVTALEANDFFGSSVSFNAAGDRLAAGAINDDGAGNATTDAGAVYLFGFSNASFGGGTLQSVFGRGANGGANVDAVALESADNFGISVALNALGDRLAVGAPGDDGFVNSGSSAGAVYLFTASALPTGQNFSVNPSGDVTIRPSHLVAQIASGASVTLQASNDITVAEAVTVTGNPGGVGALTLQAGRSVLVNAGITTQGGGVSLIGNDLAANGVIDAQREAGAAVITMAPGVSIDAGTGTVGIALRSGAGLTNQTSGDITLGSITAGRITVSNAGPTPGSDVIVSAGSVLTASAAGRAIDIRADTGTFTNSAGAGLFNLTGGGTYAVWSDDPATTTEGVTGYLKRYNVADAGAFAALNPGGSFFAYRIAPVLAVATNAASRTYGDANPAFTATLTGFIDGDTAAGSVTGSPGFTTAATTATNVGIVPVTAALGTLASAQGYQFGPFTGADLSILARPITIAATGGSKIYDGTTSSPAAPTIAVGSLANADTLNPLSQRYDGKDVLTATTLTVDPAIFATGDAANYVVTYATAAGSITPRPLAVTGVTASGKTYDGTTAATLSGAPLVTTGVGAEAFAVTPGTAAFSQANAGTNLTITTSGFGLGAASGGALASNYAIVQPNVGGATFSILARPITIAATAANKIYDGTTSSAATPTIAAGSLVGADALNPLSQRYDGKDVLTATTLSVDPATLAAGLATNYAFTYTTATGSITPKPLAVGGLTALTKTYDGTTAALLGGTPVVTTGIGAESFAVTAGTAAFSQADAGDNLTITAAGFGLGAGSGGALASNYAILQPVFGGAGVSILARPITIAATAGSKIYDGTTSSAATPTIAAGSLVGADALTPLSQRYDGKDVLTATTLTVDPAIFATGTASNYAVTYTTATGSITPRPLAVGGLTVLAKTYDGTTAAQLAGAPVVTTGVGAESFAVTPGTAAFSQADAGDNLTVTTSGFGLGAASGGALASNYAVLQPVLGAAEFSILARPITIAATGGSKIYDGTTSSPATPTIAAGSLAGADTLNPLSQRYDGKDVLTATTLTVDPAIFATGLASNYAVTYTTATGSITPKPLAVGGLTVLAKTYDGTTAAQLAGAPLVTTGVGAESFAVTPGTAAFNQADAGSNLTITTSGFGLGAASGGALASNYAILQPVFGGASVSILPRPITIAATGGSKVYDGTTSSAATPTVATGSLVGADALNPLSQRYDGKDVLTATTLSVDPATFAAGLASNYAFTYTTATGSITPKPLAVGGLTVLPKTYDGTTAAQLAGAPVVTTGVGAESFAVTLGTAAFSQADAGSNLTITASGFGLGAGSGGALASNYAILQPAFGGASFSILPRPITIAATGGSKVYDGTTSSAATPTIAAGSLIGADALTPLSQRYNSPDVLTATTLSVDPASLGTGTASNYALSYATAPGTIAPRPLSVIVDDASRPQNSANPPFTFRTVGLIAGESDSLISGLTLTTSAELASRPGRYPIVAANGVAPNYALSYTNGTLTVTGSPGRPTRSIFELFDRRNWRIAYLLLDIGLPYGEQGGGQYRIAKIAPNECVSLTYRWDTRPCVWDEQVMAPPAETRISALDRLQ